MTETFRPNDEVVWQDVLDADLVLLHPRTGVYYGLNPAGGCVWRALTTAPRTPEALARELAHTYRIDHQRATADVAGLLAGLRAADLVTTTAAPTAP